MPALAVQVEECPPGTEATRHEPGDLVLTHGSAWTSRFIRLGQRLRFVGESRKYTWWNHVAIVVDPNGDIVEALGAGIQKRNLSVYEPTEYCVIRLEAASSEDREQMVAFANKSVGLPYGFMTILSIGFGLLTGSKFTFGFAGQHICSGLAAECLSRTSYILLETESLPREVPRSSTHTMPAHIAEFFEADPPSAGTTKGKIPSPSEGRLAR